MQTEFVIHKKKEAVERERENLPMSKRVRSRIVGNNDRR